MRLAGVVMISARCLFNTRRLRDIHECHADVEIEQHEIHSVLIHGAKYLVHITSLLNGSSLPLKPSCDERPTEKGHMACEEKARLSAEYEAATGKFAAAVTELQRKTGTKSLIDPRTSLWQRCSNCGDSKLTRQ